MNALPHCHSCLCGGAVIFFLSLSFLVYKICTAAHEEEGEEEKRAQKRDANLLSSEERTREHKIDSRTRVCEESRMRRTFLKVNAPPAADTGIQ